MARTKKAKFNYKTGDLLVVRWKDIVSVEEWIPDDDAESLPPMDTVTVGWFVNNADDCIRLTSTVNEDSKNLIVIPHAVIYKITVAEYERGT
jgi:hypothetical protein